MRDVAIRGTAVGETKEVKVVLEAGIGTILGRIPIRGNVLLTYDCSSTFKSRVTYSALVRLFAKIKRVDLLTDIEGTLHVQDPPLCPTMTVQKIAGRATVEATQLSGWLMLDGDSIGFRGPAWMVGDSSYFSTLTSEYKGRHLELRVGLFER